MLVKLIRNLFKEFFGLIVLIVYLIAVILAEATILFTNVLAGYPINTFSGMVLLALSIGLPFWAIFLFKFAQKIKTKVNIK